MAETALEEAERRGRLLLAKGDVTSLDEGIRLVLDSDPALYERFRAESFSESYARELMRPRATPEQPKAASTDVAKAARTSRVDAFWGSIDPLLEWWVRKGQAPDKDAAFRQLCDDYPDLHALYRQVSS